MTDAASGSRTNSQFGPYRLLRLIGRDAVSELYEAEDTVRERIVALSLFDDATSLDAAFRTRLQRVARAVQRLREPHVAPIHDCGEIDGTLYVDARLIEGTNLQDIVARSGALAPERAVAILFQVASALDAAHEAGLLHGDFGPDKTVVTDQDFAYVLDIGIGQVVSDTALIRLGGAAGSFGYRAPEQVTGGEVTYRADVYALACVLYECLTGTTPYPVESQEATIAAHLTYPAPQPSRTRPGISPAFDDVIARGMAKDPHARYATASELMTGAARAAGTQVQQREPTMAHAIPATPARRGPKPEPALVFHDDVQFTVYRPKVVQPFQWTPLLAFAHLGEAPIGADPADDPILQVQQRAQAVLGDRISTFAQMTQDSSAGLPEDAEVTFVLDLPDFEVKAPSRTFLWVNDVHMEEFRIRAAVDLHGGTSRGQLMILHGSILLAEVRLTIRVDSAAPQVVSLQEAAPASATRFRSLFPSYSHSDTSIVMQFEYHIEALGDRYLRDAYTLRSGEVWNDKLMDLIREADVFQLFWSHNAMTSRFVEQEWRYALTLNRPEFVRPTYWEDPMPTGPNLPPPELGRLHFHHLGTTVATHTPPPSAPQLDYGAPRTVSYAPPPPRSFDPATQGSPFGAPPVGAAPPPPPPLSTPVGYPGDSAKRSRSWLPVGVVAAAVAVVLGGGGIVMHAGSSQNASANSSTEFTTAETRPSDTTRATTVPNDRAQLSRILPEGYTASNCDYVTPASGALATVNCGKNFQPDGPESATYSLFGSQQSLDAAFNGLTDASPELTACPGIQTASPTNWHYSRKPDEVAGRVACGAHDGTPFVVWTRNDDLMLGTARGPTLASLHDWWNQFG